MKPKKNSYGLLNVFDVMVVVSNEWMKYVWAINKKKKTKKKKKWYLLLKCNEHKEDIINYSINNLTFISHYNVQCMSWWGKRYDHINFLTILKIYGNFHFRPFFLSWALVSDDAEAIIYSIKMSTCDFSESGLLILLCFRWRNTKWH